MLSAYITQVEFLSGVMAILDGVHVFNRKTHLPHGEWWSKVNVKFCEGLYLNISLQALYQPVSGSVDLSF